ncbi:hypothetical protein [Streptomyces sp. NTH33]|uniref:hypothetical protein n=1 Tax=Streptomyces sp. NTH33 TaxID=1735453 RepID=UPI0011B941B7|nr:hypothetical protein [Streptomyces sp. NTH33]
MTDQRQHENRFRCTASRRRALAAGQGNRALAEPADRPGVRWVRPHAHGHAPAALARGPRAALSGALVTMAGEVQPVLTACGTAGLARALRRAVGTTDVVPLPGGAN